MTAEAENEIKSMLREVLRRLDQQNAPLEPSLTRVAFAKRIGKSINTVSRWVASGKIKTRAGLIPASEARKFLS